MCTESFVIILPHILLSIFFLTFLSFKRFVMHNYFKKVIGSYFTSMTHLRSFLRAERFCYKYYRENDGEYFSLFLILSDCQKNVVTAGKYKEFRPNAFLLWSTFHEEKCNALSVELSIKHIQRLTNKGHGNFHSNMLLSLTKFPNFP